MSSEAPVVMIRGLLSCFIAVAAGCASPVARRAPAGSSAAETLVLFDPKAGMLGLTTSQLDPLPPAARVVYKPGAPVSGRWIMGDWDADGIDTPAVYGDKGAFFYTNDLGETTDWTGIWFGAIGEAAVGGRFDPELPNDCLGVVDAGGQRPSAHERQGSQDVGFALYYVCTLSAGADQPKRRQWLGPVLPDSEGFAGEPQFGAGDFDGDTVDTIAVRRGSTVAWTNDAPPGPARFALTQQLGAPSSGYGTLVVGDWNGDGRASFGLYYANGSFYRRNDLERASGAYLLQRVGSPVGTSAAVDSWPPRRFPM